jgi:hypothetical protein
MKQLALVLLLVSPAWARPSDHPAGTCGYVVNSGRGGINRSATISGDGSVTDYHNTRHEHISPERLKQLRGAFAQSGFFEWKDGPPAGNYPDADSWYIFYDDGKRSKGVGSGSSPSREALALMKRIDELSKP